MSKKKVFLLLISLVFMMSLFSNFVSAQQEESGLASAFETIRELFGFLPDLITLEGLLDDPDGASFFWAKFLIWLLLFAVIYFGASAIPGIKDNKNIAIVISIVISLMSALLIPADIVINIFQTYSLVASIVVWCIPLIAGMVIAQKIENRITKAIIYWVSVWILININMTFVSKTDTFGQSFQYFGLLLAGAIVMAIWNTIGAFRGEQGQEGARNWVGDRARGLWDTVRGRTGTPEDEERNREREVDQAGEMNKRLGEIERELNAELKREVFNEIERLQLLANLIQELVKVQEQLNAARGFR